MTRLFLRAIFPTIEEHYDKTTEKIAKVVSTNFNLTQKQRQTIADAISQEPHTVQLVANSTATI